MPLPQETINKFKNFLAENNKKVGLRDFFARPEEHQLVEMVCDFLIGLRNYERYKNQLLQDVEKKQHRSEAAQAFVEAQENIINASSAQIANMIDFLQIARQENVCGRADFEAACFHLRYTISALKKLLPEKLKNPTSDNFLEPFIEEGVRDYSQRMKSYASNVQAAKESYDKTAQSLAEFLKNIQDNKGQKRPSAYAYIALLDITVTLFLALGPAGSLALALKNLIACIGALMAVKGTYNMVSARLTKPANDTPNPAETLKKRLEDTESKQLENADSKSKNPIPIGYKNPLRSLVNFSENLSMLSSTVQKQGSNSSLNNTSDVKKNIKTNQSK